MHTVSHAFAPASSGEFHRFTISRGWPGQHTVRVAYSRITADGQEISSEVDEPARIVAQWSLPPDAHAAFRAQIDAGWRGELTPAVSDWLDAR